MWGEQMANPFRFGVQISRFPSESATAKPDWKDYLCKLESLGYSTIFFPDHFGDQLEPLAAAAFSLAVTERLNAGTLVLDVDYRHPVIAAKSAATTQILSGGRLEFGIGAGWMRSDYEQAGIPFDAPSVRIARLEEALQITKAMWSQKTASFKGVYYKISEITGEASAFERAGCSPPKIFIGGGGRKMLELAGRHADIVGINPALPEGRVTAKTAADLTLERAKAKVETVIESAEAAGRGMGELEFSCLVFVVSLLDDPSGLRSAIASTTGMSPEQVAECPLFLTGPPSEIRERLQHLREHTGISYIVIQDGPQIPAGTVEKFSTEVVSQLATS